MINDTAQIHMSHSGTVVQWLAPQREGPGFDSHVHGFPPTVQRHVSIK